MRRIVLCALALATVFALVPATQAAADPNGAFQCRGSALRIGGFEVGASNAPGNPCADDSFQAIPINLPLGPIRLQVLGVSSRTVTNYDPSGDGGPIETGNGVGGGAQAGVLGVGLTIGGFHLQIGA
ncbi:MAG: hypothetical protein ACREGK_14825, partial [Geminicoccales bacterium]